MIPGTGTLFLAMVGGGGAAVGGAVTLIAQAATESGLGTGTLVTSGAVTVLAGALATFARFVLGREIARGNELREELREARAENRQLTEKIMGEFAPTLVRATDALSGLTSLLARGGH